jgi:hypothetical protein
VVDDEAVPPTGVASRAGRRAQRSSDAVSGSDPTSEATTDLTAGRAAAGEAPTDADATTAAETEDPTPAPPVTIDIAPPRWFANLARGSAVLCGVAGVGAGIALVASGSPVDALLTLLAGVGLAVLMYDVADRRAWSEGDVIHLHQWYRDRTLHRDEIDEFAPARASFVRWDIVAVRIERRGQVRLWVTRMLPAGRRTRTGWLDDLERWRTGRSRPPGRPPALP